MYLNVKDLLYIPYFATNFCDIILTIIITKIFQFSNKINNVAVISKRLNLEYVTIHFLYFLICDVQLVKYGDQTKRKVMRMLHIRKYDSAHQARHNAIIGFTMGAYSSPIFFRFLHRWIICPLYVYVTCVGCFFRNKYFNLITFLNKLQIYSCD